MRLRCQNIPGKIQNSWSKRLGEIKNVRADSSYVTYTPTPPPLTHITFPERAPRTFPSCWGGESRSLGKLWWLSFAGMKAGAAIECAPWSSTETCICRGQVSVLYWQRHYGCMTTKSKRNKLLICGFWLANIFGSGKLTSVPKNKIQTQLTKMLLNL